MATFSVNLEYKMYRDDVFAKEGSKKKLAKYKKIFQ